MKKRYKNRQPNKEMCSLLMFGTPLIVVLLLISVGFAAMSTSLTINGSSAFEPVGLIRVMSISQGTLTNATEQSKGIEPDAIKNMIDLNSSSSTATYTVVIKNLGQTDQVLDSIVEDLFSNNQVEYVLNGLQIGDIIDAGDEVEFTVTFRYKQDAVAPLEPRINSKLRFVFSDYEGDNLRTVFEHEGACTFNGVGNNITGSDCQEYWNSEYIDTGVHLYSYENWRRDYEVGFTIEEYNPSIQVQQAVFFNTKYENTALKWPGLVFRRDATNTGLELTQSINKGTKASKVFNGLTYPTTVKISRIDGVVYYSINGADPAVLQNMSNFNQQFDQTAWFGSALGENGVPFRTLKGTLSNMYVKIGPENALKYTVNFSSDIGTLTETSRQVVQGRPIGTLPIPTTTELRSFEGWYRNSNFTNRVTADFVPTADTTLYAKWSDTCYVAVGNNYYPSIIAAIDAEGADGTPITLTLLDDTTEKVVIPAGTNVTLDFGNHTISPTDKTKPIIDNSGTLTILSGTFTTDGATATVDNSPGGVITISGGTFIATGTKQAVYNNGGTMTITGNPTFSNTSNQRAAVHNLNNGTLTITGGTITASNYSGIKNDAGTLIIGTNDGTASSTTPSIQGKTYGIESAIDFSLYDGIAKGKTAAVSDETKITNIETGYQITNGTETISGATYHTLYLAP